MFEKPCVRFDKRRSGGVDESGVNRLQGEDCGKRGLNNSIKEIPVLLLISKDFIETFNFFYFSWS